MVTPEEKIEELVRKHYLDDRGVINLDARDALREAMTSALDEVANGLPEPIPDMTIGRQSTMAVNAYNSLLIQFKELISRIRSETSG